MSAQEGGSNKLVWFFLVPLAVTLIGILAQAAIQALNSSDSDNVTQVPESTAELQGMYSSPPTPSQSSPMPRIESPPTSTVSIAGGCWTENQQVLGTESASPAALWIAPPHMVIDQNLRYSASIETSKGTIEIALATEESPQTVNNFVCLARTGYFDETPFYRIEPGTAIYGGDPTGSGFGGPGYRLPDEPVSSDYKRGTLAMVSDGPNSGGSRFFITLVDLSGRLPLRYAIVGRVVGGQAVLDALAATPIAATPNGQENSVPPPVMLERVTITER